MRVAIWHDLPSGGGLRALVGQTSALIEMGHEVAVWSPNSWSTDFDRWWPGHVQRHQRPYEGSWEPTFLDRHFDVPLDRFNWRANALHAHARAVTDEMRAWKPDVLLVHPAWWFYASPLAQHWDGPSVLYLQEPFRPLYEAWPDNAWAAPPRAEGVPLKSRVGRFLRDYRQLTLNRRQVREEIAWVKAFDRVLVNSLFSRESLIRAYGIDPVFCPLGADHAGLARSPLLPKERYVVSVGEIGPNKDPRCAIAAVGHVPKEYRPQLRWFGNRFDEGLLAQANADAERMGVDFVFRTSVTDDELTQGLSGAACFVFCARLEPLGLSPLEANLAGTSVVAIAEGGVRETILEGVNGTLVANRDPALLGNAIGRYVQDLAWAASEGARARQHVLATHTWERAGRMLSAELAKAVQAHRGS